MATATMTLSSLPGKPNKKGISLAPERERYMQACADVAHHLIQLHEEDNGGKDVNLNALRGQISKKYKLKMIPPLTAIIAAIPEHYKKYIVPKLIAKPIRMPYIFQSPGPITDSFTNRYKLRYSCGCRNVQASQVSTHCLRMYPIPSLALILVAVFILTIYLFRQGIFAYIVPEDLILILNTVLSRILAMSRRL